MLLHIPTILTKAEVSTFRQELDAADWVDGRETAGFMSAKVKNNAQLPEAHPTTIKLGDSVLAALNRSPRFMSAALPLRVVPPLFNRYAVGQTYGDHVDGCIRTIPGTPIRVRTDLSATIFLSEPDEYEGGDLVVNDTYGEHRVKLPAGDMILYPSSSLHRVEPVTKGERVASFLWLQSLVRDTTERGLAFELDTAIQDLSITMPDDPAVLQLMNVYHNLLRRWAET